MWAAHHNSVYATEKCEVHITILSMQWKKMWGAHHNSVYAMEKNVRCTSQFCLRNGKKCEVASQFCLCNWKK